MVHEDDFGATLVRLADEAVARHVVPRPAAMAREAARRGRRRVRARAAQQVTGAVVAVAAIAALAVLPPQVRNPWLWHTVPGDLTGILREQESVGYDPYGRFLEQPGRGPLASDRDLTGRARRAWESGAAGTDMASRGVLDDVRGDPHVVWAGPTPGGPAAVVVQRAVLHVHDGLPPEDTGEKALIGYLATGDDGELHVVAADYGSYIGDGPDPNRQMLAAWVDLPRRVIVVLDPGYALGMSTGWRYVADGGARRSWSPVAFSDGAAVLDLPDDVDPTQVRIARQPPNGFSSIAHVGGQPAIRVATGPGWRPCLGVAGKVPERSDCGAEVEVLTEARERRTDVGAHSAASFGLVTGRTPDGRTFGVAGVSLDGSELRVLGLVHGPRGVDGTEVMVDAGALDPDAVLPYAVRLPGGQGWVVARDGATFRYRSSAGDRWHPAGSDAALLPDADSLEVEVTPRSSTPNVVRLDR